MDATPLICITGTTGSGKNTLGILVAERLGAEILSLDSMKVYRGMDVGTAKPSAEDRLRVSHHLIDVVDPSEHMDLARFLRLAEASLAEIRGRGRAALTVGGTAMYLTGLLYGVLQGPSRDESFRRALQEERDRIGTAALHERLRAIDPEAGSAIKPSDYQRIERALEIHAGTGKPASTFRRDWFAAPRRDARVFVVTWEREALRRRIELRVDRMFEEGWIDEVRRIEEGGGFGAESGRALGYPEIRAYLRGEAGRDESALRARIKTKTWQFARRQLTWMKRFEDARRLLCTPQDRPEELADRIVSALERP